MNYRSIRLVFLGLLTICACGGGGDWVDAPQACMAVGSVIALGNMKATLAGTPQTNQPTDLKDLIEAEVEKERKRGASEQSIQEGRQALENIIAQAARGVCGNVGKSYTGEWECNAQQQRIKCK